MAVGTLGGSIGASIAVFAAVLAGGPVTYVIGGAICAIAGQIMANWHQENEREKQLQSENEKLRIGSLFS